MYSVRFFKILAVFIILNISLVSKARAFNECAYITSMCIAGAYGDAVAGAISGHHTCTAIDAMRDHIRAETDFMAIVNSRDKNEDGFNDYAMWAKPNFDGPILDRFLATEVLLYTDLFGKRTYDPAPKESPEETLIAIWRAMLSPCGDDPADYGLDPSIWNQANLDDLSVVTAVADEGHILYEYPDIARLPGCIDNLDGTYSGWTYQIYREELDPRFAAECTQQASILLYNANDDSYDCIKKGHNGSVPIRDAGGVLTSWNNAKIETESMSGLICATTILCKQYNLVYPLNGAVEDASEAKIECRDRIGKDECDSNGDGYYQEECVMDNIRFHFSAKCSVCSDRNSCLGTDGLFDDTNCDMAEQVCGKYYNPAYMAHCVIDESAVEDVLYGASVPSFLSNYCTGNATYSNDTAFLGRIMRCVEYTMNNAMFGSSEVVKDNVLEDLVCTDTGQYVDFQSECKGGMLQHFQTGIETLVLAMMVLSVTLLGFMVLFGAVSNVREIMKYVIIFGIVSYFAIGDAWRDGYYFALQSAGAEVGTVVLNSADYGIVEGVVNSAGHIVNNVEVDNCKYREDELTGPFNIEYPHLRDRHYAVWDIYDCKFKNFFTGGSVVPNSPSTYQKILETSIFGFVSFMFPIILGGVISLLLVYLSFKVAFYAVTSFMIIVILLFISPMIIPLVLFKQKKARGIFDAWLTHLIGYSLVPIILMALIAITFLIFDYALYGTAGDVLMVNDEGGLEIKNGCFDSYLPCLYDKLSKGEYASKMTIPYIGVQVPAFANDFFVHYLNGVLRLFLVLLVMIQVFSTAITQMVQQVLGVELMSDKIVASMGEALKKIAKYGGGGGKRGASMGKAALRKLRGKGNSGYGI